MKVKSEEKLNSLLDKGLAWRKKELTHLKFLIDSSNEKDLGFNSKIGIVFLYAHWEGYIKEAGNYYLDYIRGLNLTYSQLSDNLLAFSLKIDIKICADTNKTSIHYGLIDTILNKTSNPAAIPEKTKLETNSNLNYDNLYEILFSLGIDHSNFETKKNEIDFKLVETRNKIAHGNRNEVTPDQFYDLYMDVIYMLDLYRDELINSIKNKKYLRMQSNPN